LLFACSCYYAGMSMPFDTAFLNNENNQLLEELLEECPNPIDVEHGPHMQQ